VKKEGGMVASFVVTSGDRYEFTLLELRNEMTTFERRRKCIVASTFL